MMNKASSGDSHEPEVTNDDAVEPDAEPSAGIPEVEAVAEAVREIKAVEFEQLERERDELRDQTLRIRAEFDNYRKRVLRDAERNRKLVAEQFVRDLLPVVDNLDLALQHAEDPESGLAKGVQMVFKQCLDVLQRFGVEAIIAEGEQFDPTVHEAIMQTASDLYPENAVAKVFQRGYRLGDLVLRPAKVVVSTGKAEASESVAANSSDSDT